MSECCPYDFLKDFDRWFRWHRFIHFDGLTEEQATRNIEFERHGWVLVSVCRYGGWRRELKKSAPDSARA